MGFTVFLDRDGVINQDSPDYIKSRHEFHFIPGSPEAIARLSRAGFDVIVITNQSAIGRGMTSIEELDEIFNKMTQGISRVGGVLTDIIFCPHTPDDHCSCRKPGPGMILQAAERHGIDLSRSCMVGDSVKDMECARNAGCAACVLVLTGNGKQALAILEKQGCLPDHVAMDLSEAIAWITKVFSVPEPSS